MGEVIIRSSGWHGHGPCFHRAQAGRRRQQTMASGFPGGPTSFLQRISPAAKRVAVCRHTCVSEFVILTLKLANKNVFVDYWSQTMSSELCWWLIPRSLSIFLNEMINKDEMIKKNKMIYKLNDKQRLKADSLSHYFWFTLSSFKRHWYEIIFSFSIWKYI